MVVPRAMMGQTSPYDLLKDTFAISIPVSIWGAVVFASELESGWFSFSCSGLVGLFIWLTALAYGEKRFARFTALGVLIAATLPLMSGLLVLLR